MGSPTVEVGTPYSNDTYILGPEFFELVGTYLDPADLRRVEEAFEVARQQHGQQRRRSGELFFTHPLTVAYYLAQYRLDAPALIGALLHDVAEDARLTIPQIEEQFGSDVSRLVDGVTKLKEVTAGVARERPRTQEEVQTASLHKMFEAMTADVRVVLIKLFDRLHNMRTIKALPAQKQRQKAEETLTVYAPLANRLGIWWLKSELETLSLEAVDNEAYRLISRALDQHTLKQQRLQAYIAREIILHLQAKGIKVVDIVPSPENVYNIYRTLSARAANYDKVDLPLRVVVLVEDEPTCYLALGYVHERWRPVPGKFDDYIAAPRDNLYRALHTTVTLDNSERLKVRLRSVTMDKISNIGVLARWLYTGTPTWGAKLAKRVQALFDNVYENISLEPQDYKAGVQGVVEDVFGRQVIVHTPKGDLVELPLGATPIDFAYAIHTEVGHRCQQAYVNNTLTPLNRPLADGDQVRITKYRWARPQRSWLDEDLGYLATNRARSRVRRWFRRLSYERAVDEGRRLLDEELKMLGATDRPHKIVAEEMGFELAEQLYHAIGRAELFPTDVATGVLTRDWYDEPLRNVGSRVRAHNGQEYTVTNSGGRELRLCRSCNARPGEAIVGFLRSDGGVTVHHEGCYTLRPDPMADRTIRLAWAKAGSDKVRTITVEIDVYDRQGLLLEIAQLLQEEEVNISAINTLPAKSKGTLQLRLDLGVYSPRQLVRILHRAHALVNVFAVRCVGLSNKSSGGSSSNTRFE